MRWIVIAYFMMVDIANALPNFDECGELYKNIKEHTHSLSLDETYYYEEVGNGVLLKVDFNKSLNNGRFSGWVLSRDEKQNVKLAFMEPELFKKYALSPGSKITRINGKSVDTIDDESLLAQIRKPVKLTFDEKAKRKEVYLTPKSWKKLRVLVNFETREVNAIDSKLSRYGLKFLHTLVWKDDRLTALARKTFDEYLQLSGKSDKKNEANATGFFCSFSQQKFEELEIYDPDIIVANAIEMDRDSMKIIYEMEFYPKTGPDDEDYLEIRKEIDGIGTFKAKFDFKSFPFDKQKLTFDFQVNENQLSTTHHVVPFFSAYTIEELSRGLRNLRMQEWKKTGIDYEFFYVRDIGDDTFQTGISYITNIDRQSNYFIGKVLLPIITILIISWSIFTINIEYLESRLTVSVVCLLSLIAYTFVVDQEVPKLSYLTMMDYLILLSYFFAAFSTLGAIFVHSVFLKNKIKGRKYNSYLKQYLPILFVTLIFVLTEMIVAQSADNLSPGVY